MSEKSYRSWNARDATQEAAANLTSAFELCRASASTARRSCSRPRGLGLDREKRHVHRPLHPVCHEALLEDHHHVAAPFLRASRTHEAVRDGRRRDVGRRHRCIQLLRGGLQLRRHLKFGDLSGLGLHGIRIAFRAPSFGKFRHDGIEGGVKVLFPFDRDLLRVVLSVQVKKPWPERLVGDVVGWGPHVPVRDRRVVRVA